ncbi:MAG: DNA cytosine methyltransferase, partial [Clostridiales bacterium]|nr:DNA cytosine methyltransferase [Clostridiales bacterium]
MKAKQITLFDDIIVDNFAGGGGASTGMELATGRPVNIAINHDESAILMHQRNHPYTEHYREDVWMIDPKTVTRGRHVRLAWFSPDCKHFSRAKGKALVNRNIRGLAWIVLRWAGTVRPDVIMLENVPEFVTWGPVRKGKPVKKKAGQTYKKWKSQLEDLGYKIETRVLCAADFGAPTIRKRFCLVARCDGKPIVWPERTHAPMDSEEVKSGKCKPWRAAAEIIDWSLPCYSIFESKEEIKKKYGARVNRPLKPNTQRRIAKGLDKFVLKSAKPFIVPIGYGERKTQKPRVHDVDKPLSTVVSSTKQYVCDPVVSPYIM